MKASDIPAKFPIPWGNAALPGFIRSIPVATQIGIQDGAASLTDGFPPLDFLDQAAGGVPPFGQDANGILKQITQWTRWLNAGANFVPYDAAFATSALAGYPKGAVVASTTFGYFWLCTVDDNITDPDAGGAGWTPFSLIGGATTGDLKFTIKTTADSGWLMINDGTIGDATSGATYASALYQALYVLIWNSISNSFAPVTTGRGANALADFNAHKPMQMTQMLGRALALAGAGSGLTSRALGQFLGEENHVLTGAENGPHVHTGNTDSGGVDHTHDYGDKHGSQFIGAGVGGLLVNEQDTSRTTGTASAFLHIHPFTTNSAGSGTPHNTMQPTTFLNAMVKI